MRHSVAIGITCALLTVSAATAAEAPPPAKKPRVLVYDFRDEGAGASTVHIVRESLTAALSESGRIDVVSVEEMNRLLKMEGDKEQVGCDANSDACRAEIARSLGVRYVVFGDVGKLGDITIVHVVLTDSAKAQTLARKQIEAQAAGDIPAGLRTAAGEMVRALAPAESPPPPSSPLPLVGIAVLAAGGAALVGGAAFGLYENYGVVASEDASLTFADKSLAQTARDVSYVVAGAGAVVAAAGSVLFAMSGGAE